MRITTSNHPRLSGYPWPLQTSRVTTAEVEAAWSAVGPALLGPLPRAAVVELLFRVREISATITAPNDGDPITGTTTANLVNPDESPMTVRDVFREWRQQKFKLRLESDFLPGFQDEFAETKLTPLWNPGLNTFFRPSSWSNAPIFEDENGLFHISCYADFIASNTAGTVAAALFDDGENSPHRFLADLFLASGAYSIECRGSLPGTALQLTATEWHPYSTSAGTPAWNTATGAPSNGGPFA